MMKNGDNQSNFLKGFLFGSILGAVVGIFFAPKSGKKLRSEIKEKGSEILKDAEETYKETTAIIGDVRRLAEDLKKDLSLMCQKAKEILVHGEEKGAKGPKLGELEHK